MATELEVPYATLRKQLQREPLRSWITPFLTMKGNTKYITEEGERVIRWQYPEKEPKIKELEELLVEKENQVTEHPSRRTPVHYPAGSQPAHPPVGRGIGGGTQKE